MSRRQKCRLRELTPEERAQLDHINRAHAVPASHVARAKALLAVAAQQNGVASAPLGASGLGNDAIAWAVPEPLWVCRFRRNRTGGSYGDEQTKRPISVTAGDLTESFPLAPPLVDFADVTFQNGSVTVQAVGPPGAAPAISPLGLVILTGLLGLVGVGMRRRRV